MNTLLKVFGIWIIISLFACGCAARPTEAGQKDRAVPNNAVYESILGKSLSDEVVSEFVASNHCSSANQFLLCNAIGVALWTDSNQRVETVYLYLHATNGFEPYQGDLPFGLKFYDNMAAVEYKLDRQGLGNAGLPDVGATPDHMHYRATYHQAGMTIIYNYPFADEDANIYAILLSRQSARTKDQP